MSAVLKYCRSIVNNKIQVKMSGIYHEKQDKVFTKDDLDTISDCLAPNAWFNPHKSFLGLGNYDINVILTALHYKDCEGVWFDKRKDPEHLQLSNIIGFILNIPTDYKFGIVTIPFHRRHWVAIREIDGMYYNLDSKNAAPFYIGDAWQLIVYLRTELQKKDRELFVIVTKDVETYQTWFEDSNNKMEIRT